MNEIGESLKRATRRAALRPEHIRFSNRPLPPIFDEWISQLAPVPQACVILAPGPNGNKFHSLVREFCEAGGLVIAVGQAIEILTPSAWVCYDLPSCSLPWFIEHHARAECTRIFGHNLHREGWDCEYFFRYGPGFTVNSDRLIPGILRGGGTVSGCALQLAVFARIKSVVLCGVDMSGSKYWNGSGVRGPHGPSGVWPHLPRLIQMIKTIRLSQYKSEIYTLSAAAHNALAISAQDFATLFPAK